MMNRVLSLSFIIFITNYLSKYINLLLLGRQELLATSRFLKSVLSTKYYYGAFTLFFQMSLCPCSPIGSIVFLWVPIGSYGFLWVPMGSYGFLCVPMCSFGFLWVAMGS